jgi:hypothetical protein
MHEHDPLRQKWLDHFDALIAEAEDLGQKGLLVQGRPRVTAFYTGEVLGRDSDYVTVDAVKFEGWKEKCIALLNQVIPKDNPSYKLVKDFQRRYYPSSSLSLLKKLAARLSAVGESFRAGLFNNLSTKVSAESAVEDMAQAKNPSQEQAGLVNLPRQTDAGTPKSRTRRKTPTGTEAAVLLKSKRRCCLCYGLSGDDLQKRGQLAHIDRDPSNSDESNLAFLCLKHHDQYDTRTSQSKGLTPDELRHHRDALYAAFGKSGEKRSSKHRDGSVGASKRISGLVNAKIVSHFVGDDNLIVGRDLNYTINVSRKGRGGKPIQVPVSGTVSADPIMRGYLKYLFDRYLAFKKWDCDRNGVKLTGAPIYRGYKRDMKFDWKLTPKSHFEKGAEYLKQRIDKTTLGKMKRAQGNRLYRSFEEFQALGPD